jgi:transposase
MFKEYNQNQTQLLPRNLEESIEKDHIARLISQVIDEMDTSFIESAYSNIGQRAYHPKALLKVLVYGYTIGVRSSRKLDDKLKEDVVFMWLSGRQSPDFRTIADFRKNKLVDVKKVFPEVLKLCQELGMVRIGKVSIDGTKFRADASGNRMRYRKVLFKNKVSLENQADDILKEADDIDREEEKLLGDKTEHQTGVSAKEIENKLKKTKKRKETLGRKKDKLEARKDDINAKLRKMRKDRNSMGITDKDAAMMLMKEGYIAPGYNARIAAEHQVILAYGLFSDRNDQKLLKPMVNEIKTNTGKDPEVIPADAGYGNKTNYRFLKNRKIAAFIPYNNFNKEMAERRKGIYQLPKNINVELERYKARQRMRLLSPEGKKMMERRREDVEPTIGDIKRNMNFRAFGLRGKPKCLIELGLVSIGHNLKKMKSWVKKSIEREDGREKTIVLETTLGYLYSK